jgi:hypothetical protein
MSNQKGEIDSSRVPVEGAAGFGLLVMAAVVIYVLAPLRTLAVPALLGAAVIGMTLLAWRHRETRRFAIGGLVIAVIALVAVIVTQFVRS